MKAYATDALLFAAAGTTLADDARAVRVQFEPGTSSAVVTDRIKGYEYVLYKLRAREGQFLSVSLRPDNQSIDFNSLRHSDSGFDCRSMVLDIAGYVASDVFPVLVVERSHARHVRKPEVLGHFDGRPPYTGEYQPYVPCRRCGQPCRGAWIGAPGHEDWLSPFWRHQEPFRVEVAA